MGTIGRHVRAALLVAAIAATTAVGAGGAATPASAQAEPEHTVTVTPSTGLRDGDTVEVTTTGLSTTDLFGVLQCDVSVLGNLPSGFSGPCVIKAIRQSAGPADTTTITLSGSFRGADGSIVRCGDEPDDCAIISWSPFGWQAGAGIDMEPTPVTVFSPAQEAGYPVELIVTGPDGIGATAKLAQCKLPVGPDVTSSVCSALQPLALDADGNAIVPFTLVAEVGDPPYACGEYDCAATLFDDAGTVLGSAPVVVEPDDGPPRMSAFGIEEATDGGFVNVTIDGVRNESFDLAQCAASVTATHDVAGGPCTPAFHGGGRADQGYDSAYLQLQREFTGTDGTQVTCADNDDCVLALAGSSGAFTALPITWNVPDVVVISPTSGVLDGQVITVDGSGLTAGDEYAVMRCSGSTSPDYCETSVDDAPKVTTSAEGTISTTVTAAQRFTRTDGTLEVCRDDCAVVLQPVSTGSVTQAPYTMANGTLEAAPSSGVQDGQPVAVSWSGTQPSYDGPLWWILQTGAWALGQCGAGILDDTSVANVFRQCAVPPGGGAVTVAAPDGGAEIEVQATIQPPIGGPIDCTANAEACVAVLVRVEQDASVTLLSSPLTFA